MKTKIFLIGFCIMVSLTSFGQIKETYWKIFSIYSENNEYVGMTTASKMESIFESNPHFKKNGDTLNFDFPEKRSVLLDTLESLSGKRYGQNFYIETYRGQLADSIYFKGIENDYFKIKFKSSVSSDAKNIIIQFKGLSEDEYYNSLTKADSVRTEQNKEVEKCIEDFMSQKELEVLPTETYTQYFEDFDKTFKIQLAKEHSVEYRGSLYSHTFDELKIGFASNNVETNNYYEIQNNETGSEFTNPLLVFSVEEKTKFDYATYIEKTFDDKRRIVYQDDNSIAYLDASYDTKEGKALIQRITLFKYFYVQNTHVIFSNDVPIKNNDFSLFYKQFQIMKVLNVE